MKRLRVTIERYDIDSGVGEVETVTAGEILGDRDWHADEEVALALDRLIETGEPQSVLGQGERWTYSLPEEVPA